METKLSCFSIPSDGTWLYGSSAETRGDAFSWRVHDQLQSAVWVSRAPQSRFAKVTQLSDRALDRSLAIEAVWVRGTGTAAAASELLPALYQALQQGRVWNCTSVVAHVTNLGTPLSQALQLAALPATPEYRAGQAHQAAAQMLDFAIFGVAQKCSPEAWAVLRKGLAREALATVRSWVMDSFFQGSWAQSILRKTMTREQYAHSLCSMHHYVRQTTQHLGRAIGFAKNRDLRRHLIGHLNGEINHEVSLENDLRNLGDAPDYLVHHRVPNSATKSFMAVQEAAVAFYQEPMLLMAAPLAAEGITAHFPASFLPSLHDLIASWGVARPERAMSFLASHAHHDGGDEGHWEATAAMLESYLVDEPTQRKFLVTLRAAAECIERSFNANIDELLLFSETNEKGTLKVCVNQ